MARDPRDWYSGGTNGDAGPAGSKAESGHSNAAWSVARHGVTAH